MEVVTTNEQSLHPVARPSKTRLEIRRKIPPHLLEGKGQAAASSSVTVPVHNQTAATAKSKITGTCGDLAIKTVLQNLVKVFEPKNSKYHQRLA